METSVLAIRHYRQKRCLSQKTLAEIVGTRQATISAIEQGAQRPTDEMLGRIADALGVEPAFTLLRPISDQGPDPEDDQTWP